MRPENEQQAIKEGYIKPDGSPGPNAGSAGAAWAQNPKNVDRWIREHGGGAGK